MNRFFALLKNEIKGSLRDRPREIFGGILLMAVTFPWMPLLLMANVDLFLGPKTETLNLPVIGQRYAPGLMGHMNRHKIFTDYFDGDVKKHFRERNDKIVLSIHVDFEETFSNIEPKIIDLYYDDSLYKSQWTASRLNRFIPNHYRRRQGSVRLRVHRVDPSITHAVKMENKTISLEEDSEARKMASHQISILLIAFFSAFLGRIESTRNNNEQKLMASLSALPRNAFQMRAVKGCAVLSIPLITTLTMMLSTTAFLQVSPVNTLCVEPQRIFLTELTIIAFIGSLAFFAQSIYLWSSIYVKWVSMPFKAMTGVQIFFLFFVFMILPEMAAWVPYIQDLEPATWRYFVPVLGQAQLLKTVIRCEVVSAVPAIMSASATTLFALGLFAMIPRLLHSRGKRIVYGG